MKNLLEQIQSRLDELNKAERKVAASTAPTSCSTHASSTAPWTC